MIVRYEVRFSRDGFFFQILLQVIKMLRGTEYIGFDFPTSLRVYVILIEIM